MALLLVACDGTDAISWGGTVDTLASGVVVVRSPAEGVWRDHPSRLDETLRLGSLQGGGPDQFGRVVDVTVDELDRVYVLDGHAKEVRVFAADGGHVRNVGRPGAGPGEFGQPLFLDWGPNGHLWITDFGNRRYEVFDTAGVHVGSHTMSTGSFGFGNGWRGGRLHERVVEMRSEGPRRRTVRRRLMGDSLVVVDTLPLPETTGGETVEVTIREGDASFTSEVSVPLTPRAVRSEDSTGGWWISDPGGDYRIARLDLQADTVLVLEREYEPVPVSDEQRRRALESIPGGADVPMERIPSVHPPVEMLLPGPDGLWVKRRTAVDRTGYDVFDEVGRYLGELRTDLPLDRFRLMERTRHAAFGVLLGPLDVPYVLRLSVTASAVDRSTAESRS